MKLFTTPWDQITWINFEDYSNEALILNGIGCLFWLICYASFIKHILQKKFVEMPWFIAAGNLSWEFLWSFYAHPNTGYLYELSYQGAFLMDVFIFVHILKYGSKQLTTELSGLKKIFKPMAIITLIAWTAVLYFFIEQSLDDNIGARSGYILNVIISILYPLLYMRLNKPELFSITIGWSKWLGTGLIAASMFLIFPDHHMAHILGVCCFLLDGHYFFNLLKDKKKLKSRVV